MSGNVIRWSGTAFSDGQASVLAIGDSWFWYPFVGGSILEKLAAYLKNGDNIIAIGNNGAEAYDFASGMYASRLKYLLKFYGAGARAVLISAGGNDFAGFDDLRPMLRDDCSGCTTAQACFNTGSASTPHSFDWLQKRVQDSYSTIVGSVLAAVEPDVKVYVHTYAYAHPSGDGIAGKQWLLPSLLDAKVPPHLRQGCVNLLIDRHAAMLTALANNANGRVVVIDTRNVLPDDIDWANELHPKSRGFDKLVSVWLPYLKPSNVFI